MDPAARAIRQVKAQALVDIADVIEERANSAGRIIRNPSQQPLCATPCHDDRWCTDCDRMEAGMDYAAQMCRAEAERLEGELTR